MCKIITLQEISPPIKLSGLSSIIVKFNYNQYIVDTLKTFPTYYYHKKDKTWEIPICYLGRLLDSLTFFDDMQLELLDTPKSQQFRLHQQYNLEPLSEIEKISFKASPFPHQLEAVDFLLTHEKSLLLDGCGVGKSLEMILFAETLKKRGLIEHCLIITGIAGLRSNWEKEIKKFSNESSIVIGKYITRNGTIRYRSMVKRAEQLKNKIDEFFVLLNVESIRDPKIIEAIKKSENKFDLIMFDEIHKCLTYDTVLDTETGSLTIGEIVEGSLQCKVKSLNLQTNQIEYTPVINVMKNFPVEPILELSVEENNKVYKLNCTASHKIYTKNRGYVKAKDLTEYDDIVIN